MTRMRDARSDWAEFARRRQREPTQAENRLLIAWQTPPERRTPEQWALIAGHMPEQPAPVQHERTEMESLYRRLRQQWWRWGWWHHEAATWDDREAQLRHRLGVRPGWPDCELHIPDPDGGRALAAYCELKRPDLRPRRNVPPRWWLEGLAEGKRSRYGVSGHQLAVLAMLHECGYETMVAYSADEAFQWLDQIAGPRPEQLPRSWRWWLDGAWS